MAGIGFELRRLLRRDSFAGLFKAYAYAGIISSGPWVLSILGILVIGLVSKKLLTVPDTQITRFQVSVTYLIMLSLVLTGPIQLSFTRWVADRLFEKRAAMIAPNFLGALLIVIVGAGLLGLLAVATLWLPRRACAVLLVLVLAVHLGLLNDAPTSAYFAQTLQAWEQGRFIRFFGMGQWLGWLWPYATLLYVLLRVSRKEGAP